MAFSYINAVWGISSINEMSYQLSLLNTSSSSSSKFEEFNLTDIVVPLDREEQPWFKEVHIWKFLGIRHMNNFLSVTGNWL